MPIGNRTEDAVDVEVTEPDTQQANVLFNISLFALGAGTGALASGLLGLSPSITIVAGGGLVIAGAAGLILAARRRSDSRSSATGTTIAAFGAKPTLAKCSRVETPTSFSGNSLIAFCKHRRPDKPIASVWINYPSSTVMLHTTSPVPQIAASTVPAPKAVKEVYLCDCLGKGKYHVGLIDVDGKLLTPQVCTDKCREYKAA